MPYPSNNRQNYRMRANTVPPPTKNPYLSRQELRKKALEYNVGQQPSQDRTPDSRSSGMQNQTNNMNQRMMPENMLQNSNGSNSDVLPPFPTEIINLNDGQTAPSTDNTTMTPQRNTRPSQTMTPMESDWASPSTRSWMDSLQTVPSSTMPEQPMNPRSTPRSNPYEDNRSFPWMNPRGDQRLSPSSSRGLENPPPWLRRNNSENGAMNRNGSRNSNPRNNMNAPNSSIDFLPRTDRENQEYMKMIRRHPEDVRRIYTEVQKAFDRLDYNGSWIYDENPDRATLLRLSEDIYRSLLPITEGYNPNTDNPNQAEEENRTPGLLPNKTSTRWMLYVIFVLVQNELTHRRA